MLTVSRTVSFCAAHRLYNPSLSPEENTRIYGKCSREGGHGHNYTLTVSVTGDVDEETGMIVNVSALKDVLHTHVVSVFDHRNLSTDVACLVGVIPTMENLTRVIAAQLTTPLSALGVRLVRVTLAESDAHVVTLETHG